MVEGRVEAMTPPVSLEISIGICTILVRGKRSTRGWDVVRVDGCHSEPQGHRKSKDDALQLARDCCEPNLKATFLLKPTPK